MPETSNRATRLVFNAFINPNIEFFTHKLDIAIKENTVNDLIVELSFSSLIEAEIIARALLIGLSTNLSLQTLVLQYNHQPSQPIDKRLGHQTILLALSIALNENRNILAVHFINFSIDENNALRMAQTLRVNHVIEEVSFYNANLSEKSVIALAEMLLVNTTLTHFELAANQITLIGATALAKAIKINTTLQSINLCEISYVPTWDECRWRDLLCGPSIEPIAEILSIALNRNYILQDLIGFESTVLARRIKGLLERNRMITRCLEHAKSNSLRHINKTIERMRDIISKIVSARGHLLMQNDYPIECLRLLTSIKKQFLREPYLAEPFSYRKLQTIADVTRRFYQQREINISSIKQSMYYPSDDENDSDSDNSMQYKA